MSAVEPNQYPDPDGRSQRPEPGREDGGPLSAPEVEATPAEYPTLHEAPPDEEYPTMHEPTAPPPAERPRGVLGQVDPVSVGAGLVFFLIGGAYLLATGGHLTVNAGWTLSLLLLGLGLSGVVGALLGRVRRSSQGRR